MGHASKIVSKCKSGKFVSMVSFPKMEPEPKTLVLPRTIAFYASWFIRTTIKTRLTHVGWKTVAVKNMSNNGIGKAVYSDFLPKAFRNGTFVAAPEPEIVGKGLEHVQTAFDRQERGMSAGKAVVIVQ